MAGSQAAQVCFRGPSCTVPLSSIVDTPIRLYGWRELAYFRARKVKDEDVVVVKEKAYRARDRDDEGQKE